MHSLLTFGGLDNKGNWCYPKHKTRIAPFQYFRISFRDTFLKLLSKFIVKSNISLSEQDILSIEELKTKSWSFFVTKPTMETETIENYLARYINKIAVGNSRIEWLKETEEVRLVYNDYKNQTEDEAAPKKIKSFSALGFIHQYLCHVPPPYFQRTRRYGHHASASRKKNAEALKDKVRKNGNTVRTILEIITQLLKVSVLSCEKCQHDQFETEMMLADSSFKQTFLHFPSHTRSP